MVEGFQHAEEDKQLRHLQRKQKVEAQRELEALEQALKADTDLLSQQQARDLILAAEALKLV